MTTVVAPSDAAAREPVGSRLLWRLMLRHDRVLVPVWYAVLVLTCYASAAARLSLYRDDASVVAAAQAVNANAGIVALYGPILDVHSVGELSMTKLTVLYAVLVSVMMLFVVRRHTRGDEDAGRSELLGAAAVDSTAPLRATLGYGSAVALVLGVLVAGANIVGSLPVAGSLAFGAAWAGTGLVAVGVSAVACQLGTSPRTCAALASLVFGVLYMVRAIGDASSATWLSWLSPYGWNTRLAAYGNTRWPVLLLYLVTAGLLMVAADRLRARRDLGSGLIGTHPGRSVGTVGLGSALSLTLRTHAAMLAGWTAVVFVMGVIFGALIPGFDAFNNSQVEELLARLGGSGDFRDMMIAAVMSTLALVISCFAVVVTGHAGADEREGRSEQMIATTASRGRVLGAVVLVSLLGATWLLAVNGLALASGLRGRSGHSFVTVLLASLGQAPAVWVVAALGVLCFALGARWAVAGWAFVVAFASLGQVAELLDMPRLVTGLSPFSHVAKMPQEPFRPLPAALLTVSAGAILGLAWLSYRRRDIG